MLQARSDSYEEIVARQLAFERDNLNVENAARYFKELNRRGDYAKVKQLWTDNEVDYLGTTSKERNPAYVQYQYAIKNTTYLKKALEDDSSGSAGGVENLQVWIKQESSKKYEESLQKLGLDNSKIQGKHLVSYSLDELQNEKKRVKNELKVYD